MPTARQVLETMRPEPFTPMTTETAPVLTPRSWVRPAIAFSLVAGAVVTAGGTAWLANSGRVTSAQAESVVAPTTAPPPTATPLPAAVAAQQEAASLQSLLTNFAAPNADKYGIVVTNLKTGATASVNAAQATTSASLYKLFVAQQIYRQIDNGQLDSSQAAGGGTGRTVASCLDLMITVSDNDCGRALGSILNWQAQDASLQAAGYPTTTPAPPQQTSARDVATLLQRLYDGTLNSPSSNDRLLGLLKAQRVNNRLPTGLPAGTLVAHKTGDLDGYVHDAGIVYGPKADYLVVVMSGSWDAPGTAPAQFTALSQQLWNFFEQ